MPLMMSPMTAGSLALSLNSPMVLTMKAVGVPKIIRSPARAPLDASHPGLAMKVNANPTQGSNDNCKPTLPIRALIYSVSVSPARLRMSATSSSSRYSGRFRHTE